MIATLAAPVGIIVACMLALWVASLRIRDVSIVDIFWGVGFALAAWTARVVAGGSNPRGALACVLVTAWGLRLAVHIARRNLGHGEDYRYRAMRERYGARFPIVSLFLVFLMQAGLLCAVAVPVIAVQAMGADRPFGLIDVAGVAIWTTGLVFEAVGDAQLAAFKRVAPKGAVMDRGLWRYSRHPNYFGDCLVWWGLGTLGVAAGAWWALIGPVVMTVLLVKVSGVAMLEATITERRPAYADYIRRTSAFVPWPPRRSAGH